MKTDEAYKDKRYIYDSKPEIDEFWNDCMDQKKPILNYKQNNASNINSNQRSQIKNINQNRYQQVQDYPPHGRNKNSRLKKNSNIKTYNSAKLFNNNNKSNYYFNSASQNIFNNIKLNSTAERLLENAYFKDPEFIEEMKEQEIKRIKSKNALIRCVGLYAYGLELKKTKKINQERNDEQKIIDDLSKCTFKPKVNKRISYLDDNKINNEYGLNRLYKNHFKKFMNKSAENSDKKNIYDKSLEECTFNPKFESDPNAIKKLFRNKSKQNQTISDNRGNAEFILRYTKARDEYLIKRFKKMYRKDDSYDKSLLSLTKRLCNKQYRNYLNVNNTIDLFGETISSNNQIHSSIADFRGLSVYNEIPEKKESSKNNDYIIGLRRNLHNLNLNENNEEVQ